MKLTYLFCKSFCIVLFLALSFTMVNAQSRYKHLPRVKIKKSNVEVTTVEQVQPMVTTKTEAKNETNEAYQATVGTEVENTDEEIAPVSFVEKTIANTPLRKNSIKVKHKTDLPSIFGFMSKTLKKLHKPETFKKTNASVVIILLVVFYILAAVFAVVSILYLYIPPGNFIMFLVFLILAIVFGLAASILSILLKFGVVN